MSNVTLDISNLDKAKVLAALYNAAKPIGMGLLHYVPAPMTEQEAADLLRLFGKQEPYFDYLKGRVMKVSLEGPHMQVFLYDRDNGPGAAERALREAGLDVVIVPET